MSDGRPTEAGDRPQSGNGVSIGARLRNAREQHGLTTAAVAKQLRLDESVVSALEADDSQHLPAPIFVQGYLRSYARLLGLPEDELLVDFSRQGGELPPLTVTGVTERRPWLQLPSVKLMRNLILLVLAAILIWMAVPYVGKLLDSREALSGDERAPGQLEIPPAEH